MKQTHTPIAAAALALMASTSIASAASCTAEYKAKQDNPLRLAHTTMTIDGPCTLDAATSKVQTALAAQGWTLLKLLSVTEN